MSKIFLIGYMGAGKTTLGKALAFRINSTFIDLDWYIEEKVGESIPSYFLRQGENSFRELEHNSLKEILQKKNLVVATGGGAPCFYNNMDLMLKSGVVVLLEVSHEVLFCRLKGTMEQRPILKSKTEDELKEFIVSSLNQRMDFYSKATYKINADYLESDEEITNTVDNLLKILNV